MKTIFVTVREFINNGGLLVEGRELFKRDGNYFTEYAEYLKLDQATQTHLAKNVTYKSVPISKSDIFVKIEVKPIYQ